MFPVSQETVPPDCLDRLDRPIAPPPGHPFHRPTGRLIAPPPDFFDLNI